MLITKNYFKNVISTKSRLPPHISVDLHPAWAQPVRLQEHSPAFESCVPWGQNPFEGRRSWGALHVPPCNPPQFPLRPHQRATVPGAQPCLPGPPMGRARDRPFGLLQPLLLHGTATAAAPTFLIYKY